MTGGPGRFDAICTMVREMTAARAAIVLVIGETPESSGFSVQVVGDHLLHELPGWLEQIAAQVRNDLEGAVNGDGGNDGLG